MLSNGRFSNVVLFLLAAFFFFFSPNYFHISFEWQVVCFSSFSESDNNKNNNDDDNTIFYENTFHFFIRFLASWLTRSSFHSHISSTLWNNFSHELLSFVDNLLNYFISLVRAIASTF